MRFGDAGAYERISGRAHFAVDPRAAAQARWWISTRRRSMTHGLVRFAADFMILKPREMERGNRRCILRLWQSRSQARAAVLQ